MGSVDDDCTLFSPNIMNIVMSAGQLCYREEEYNFDDSRLCNVALCRACGGMCCQTCGCYIGPRDFRRKLGVKKLSLEAMCSEIEKGYFVIEIVDLADYYIDGFGWVVRMRFVGEEYVIIDKLIRDQRAGACVMWNRESGCGYSWEDRPIGGKLLVPGSFDAKRGEYSCSEGYGVKEAVQEWLGDDGAIIRELVRRYKGVKIPMPDCRVALL